MMEPERLLESAETPPELRALVNRAPRARALDPVTHARVRKRLLRELSPAGRSARSATAAAFTGLSALLSASIVSAAVGVASGVVTISAFVYGERIVNGVLAPQPSASVRGHRVVTAPAPSSRPSSAALAVSADIEANPPAQRPSAPGLGDGRRETAEASSSLGEESRLLERARSELQRQPAHALDHAREHTRRFKAPRLAQERTLIEIDALHRLGRDAEARALAERALAAGAGNLHAARLRRLLESMGSAGSGAR